MNFKKLYIFIISLITSTLLYGQHTYTVISINGSLYKSVERELTKLRCGSVINEKDTLYSKKEVLFCLEDNLTHRQYDCTVNDRKSVKEIVVTSGNNALIIFSRIIKSKFSGDALRAKSDDYGGPGWVERSGQTSLEAKVSDKVYQAIHNDTVIDESTFSVIKKDNKKTGFSFSIENSSPTLLFLTVIGYDGNSYTLPFADYPSHFLIVPPLDTVDYSSFSLSKSYSYLFVLTETPINGQLLQTLLGTCQYTDYSSDSIFICR